MMKCASGLCCRPIVGDFFKKGNHLIGKIADQPPPESGETVNGCRLVCLS